MFYVIQDAKLENAYHKEEEAIAAAERDLIEDPEHRPIMIVAAVGTVSLPSPVPRFIRVEK